MRNQSSSGTAKEDPQLIELAAIKKLLILQLLNADIQAVSIAKLLGMKKSAFSKMFPARELLPKKNKEKR